MRPRRTALLAVILLAAAAPAAIPPAFRGAWAHNGHCTTPTARLTITATTAALGQAPAQPILFDHDDGPNGESALHWAQPGNADNFTAGPGGTLIHNPEGYGMGQPETFRRCPP
jgi:hypothetical protein